MAGRYGMRPECTERRRREIGGRRKGVAAWLRPLSLENRGSSPLGSANDFNGLIHALIFVSNRCPIYVRRHGRISVHIRAWLLQRTAILLDAIG
jgi:hypothetical protein